jgi:hypothetical protein
MAKFEKWSVTVELFWDASREETLTVKCKEANLRETALEKAKKLFGTEMVKVIRYKLQEE